MSEETNDKDTSFMMQTPQRRTARRIMQRKGQAFFLQMGTIVGDAFYDVGKTTVYRARQKAHRRLLSETGVLIGITACIQRPGVRDEHVTCYKVGETYPVYFKRSLALYETQASHPSAYARVISIREHTGGWEINIERTAFSEASKL